MEGSSNYSKVEKDQVGKTETRYLNLERNMDYSIKTITKIDQSIIYFIHAFIIQIISNQSREPEDMPHDLVNIIILFAFNFEYFSKYGNCVIIKANKFPFNYAKLYRFDNFQKNYKNWAELEKKNVEYKSFSIYGNVDIKGNISCLYLWKISIIAHDPNKNNLAIGIDASNRKYLGCSWIVEAKVEHYGISSFIGGIWKCRMGEVGQYRLKPLDANDVVTMELRVNSNDKSTLKYYVNDIDQGFAFDDICFDDNIHYNLAIGIYEEVEIELIDFSRAFF